MASEHLERLDEIARTLDLTTPDVVRMFVSQGVAAWTPPLSAAAIASAFVESSEPAEDESRLKRDPKGAPNKKRRTRRPAKV